MKQIRTFSSGELQIEYFDSVNYVEELNGLQIIDSLCIVNNDSKELFNLKVRVNGYYFPMTESESVSIKGNSKKHIIIDLQPSIDRLRTLTEAVFTEFTLTLLSNDTQIAEFRFPITLQAWNQWCGKDYWAEGLVSFVMPNHPYVASLIEKVSAKLSMVAPGMYVKGYHVDAPEEVMLQLRTLWDVIVEEWINYIRVTGNLIDSGQRIATPEQIARHRQGCCMDLTLLFCSCLERMGFDPIMLCVPGHIMPGVWLKPNESKGEIKCKGAHEIRSYLGRDNQVIVFESTAACVDSERHSFSEAIESTDKFFIEDKDLEYLIDVKNSRVIGMIRTIPYDSSIMESTNEEFEIHGQTGKTTDSSRLKGWERKLLDLSLRNSMLNIRQTKTMVALSENSIPSIYNRLEATTLSEIVGPAGKDNTELLKSLHRAARLSIEENGANSLFVAIGTLRWFDIDDSRQHLAPLIFIPVSIVRKKAMTFEIRLRDDEPMINVTLIEMLRQMFGVMFPDLSSLPELESGLPDWQKIFALFNEQIEDINKHSKPERQWKLLDDSHIGIFSFTKFLMWHNVHFHPEVIERHKILRGFIDNHYNGGEEIPEANVKDLEMSSPMDLMLPISYDSSQIEAVAECHAGRSFVLHGPPGTGKSQTITNMIANLLYQGKRVLFVAEKKAALEVVRTRLNSIGLGPYSLELHSNKADKKSFFAQVEKSNIGILGSIPGREHAVKAYEEKAPILSASLTHLRAIADALHQADVTDISLFESINRTLERKYSDLVVSFHEIKHLSPAYLSELVSELRALDLVIEIMGYHPAESTLIGLYPKENTAENQQAVTETLRQMPERIARARKKAHSLLNRWIFKRTEEEILDRDAQWKRLNEIAFIDAEKQTDIDTIERHINQWVKALEDLRSWYHFSDKANLIRNYQLPSALNYFLEGKEGNTTADAVERAYYSALSYYAIDTNSALRGFSGKLHEDAVKRYQKNDAEFQKLRNKELVSKIQQAIITARLTDDDRKELALLQRRLQAKRCPASMRKIVSESFAVLQRLFPCMLMSPLSVAQYLEMASDLFDVVIFDEASQMETPDAVGTIARGRSLIVVGDPMQLPPTRFFATQTAGGDEIEESEDGDSILEDCITLGLPSRYLSRHYRSRHESLIAFSNAQFYDNRLLTFPSADDSLRKVSLIDPQGVYDLGKSRTNRIEAEAVVNKTLEIFEQSATPPSVGIVAFSKAQSNLIEDILTAKLQHNKKLQQSIDEAEEPLFIKNLENVQGDERDIIIFSIGYGPDKHGNVSLNFGPLNQAGGERRLNVAVSRARCEMILFSSLLPHHIPAGDVVPRGVQALREFLTYARDGVLPSGEVAEAADCDFIINQIAEGLRQHGHTVKTRIGRSTFKVDLAIVDPENPEQYKLGIILDGRDYYALPSVRDREITAPSVLASLGWRLYRVWTIDWFQNPEATLQRLLAAI